MFNAVAIGDVHCTVDSIEDCQSLIEFAKNKAQEKSCKNIFFLGDLFHTHQVIQSAVLSFWKSTFDLLLKDGFTLWILKGNHDKSQAGADDCAHALEVFKGYHANLNVLDRLTKIDKNIWAIPHYYKQDNFWSDLNNIPQPSTIFTHNTFNGSKFDNGFYAPDGFDISKQPHYFISGHLHTHHELPNCIYTGAPRAFTASDANKQKFIWYFEILGKNVIVKESFDTGSYVTRFFEVEDSVDIEGSKALDGINLNLKTKVIVNIRGTESYIQKRLDFYNDLRKLSDAKFQIRTYVEKKKKLEVKESDGIRVAFKKYFDKFEPRFGSDKQKLHKIIEERAEWLITK